MNQLHFVALFHEIYINSITLGEKCPLSAQLDGPKSLAEKACLAGSTPRPFTRRFGEELVEQVIPWDRSENAQS